MTPKQRIHFFAQLWPDACAALERDPADREFRLDTLTRWLGRTINSIADVDRLKDFDLVKSECLALSQPTNVHAQMRQVAQPRIRLLHKIRHMAPDAYVSIILRDKFAAYHLDELSDSELIQLRNTLAARSNTQRRKARQEQQVEVNCPF